MKRRHIAVALVAGALGIAGCGSAASVASHNLSVEADNFQIARKITFYNGITGQSILVIEGFCSLGSGSGSTNLSQHNLTVTCEVKKGRFIKDFLGLSDNVTYVAEQMYGQAVSTTHYLVIWRPSTLIPGISVQPSTGGH